MYDMQNTQRPRIARFIGKFSACRTLLGTIFTQYLNPPHVWVCVEYFSSYEKVLLCIMDEDGEASAETEVVAEQNDEVVVEATEEEQWQANPRYKTTTNTPTKLTWP